MASLLRESHPLTLKVMRLSKPSLADTQVLPVDSADSVLSQALRDIEQNNPTQSGAVFSSDVQASEGMAVLDALPLSETLVLPRAFGTMYLGETFGAHLCICNESTLAVREILVQISMQTTTQQVPLVDTGDAGRQLAAGQPLNLQVVHEIKELGAHVLACSITYLSAQGERRTLQKSFKFQVANPLVVKTKVNHLARDVLLEVQVHNATPAAMALERLRFDPAAPFVSEDLNTTAEGAPVWGTRAGFMQPGDVRQYLYRLRPQVDSESMSVEQERAVQYATALGKLDIVWRGAFGSVGRLQTSQLLRKSPGMFLIEIESARVLDGRVVVEEPLVARVRVRNVSEQQMTVVATVNAHKHPMVVVCGPAQHALGELEVGESAEFDLQLLALAPGVQRVGAVVLVDSISGYTREVDHLLDVNVHSN